MGLISNNINVKHQSSCYRVIGGRKFTNYSDLFYSDAENEKVIAEAKTQFKRVRVIHRSNEESSNGEVFKLRAVFVNND